MANSYSISSARDWRPAMVDMPATVVTGHPYIAEHTASLAIFNRATSNRRVRIKRINVRDNGMTTVVGSSLFQLQRITAYTGGQDTEYIKLNSVNANLPSQVVTLEDINNVTVSSNSVIRRGINMPEYNIAAARLLNPLTAAVLGERRTGMSNANTYLNHNNTAVQNFVLRENEGFAITPVSNAVSYTMKFLVNVMFKIGSSTYMTAVNVTTEPRPTYVLFNNTGSGVVVEVLSVEIAENGTDEFPNIITVEPIDYLDTSTAEPVSALVALNSANESLTGLVDITSFARVHMAGYNDGAFMQKNILRRFAGTNSLAAPGVALGAFNFAARRWEEDKNSISDIVLNPGEGIGMFKRTGSGIGKLGIALIITVEEISTPSGGEFGFGFV